MSLPNYPALLLNADFQPMRAYPLSVWDFARTLRNVLKERVQIIDTYDAELRSPSFTYRPPSVVALKRYIQPARSVAFNRVNLFQRDGCQCQYCGEHFDTKELTFDHVVPQSKGGDTSWTNIVAACAPCNRRKGDGQDMKPLRLPKEPTHWELARARPIDKNSLHQSWLDYVYWDSDLSA